MSQYIFTLNGLPSYSATVSGPDVYTNKAFYGDLFAVLLEQEIAIEALITNYYYSSSSGQFELLPIRPSIFHAWDSVEEVWKFASDVLSTHIAYIAQINETAQNKIFSKYPQTKQANLQARWSELVYEDMLLGAGVLTNQNGSEGIAIRAVWAWIKDIRARSNVATNTITALSDENTIVAEAELILNNFKLEIENL